ncbi:MAG: hypothetical protein LUD50_07605 [Clostridia bacterium]|nr:hypothetical protein [Clostridia bacterium]
MMKIEDYYTPWEIFEAMKMNFAEPSDRRLYENAPSETVRKYYVLQACESLAFFIGKDLGHNGEKTHGIIKQYHNAMSADDWEYLSRHASSGIARYTYHKRAEELRARQQAEDQPTGEE